MNTELMNQIEAVGSRLEKERLLAGETDTRFLKWALDPAITFGVTVTKEQVEEFHGDCLLVPSAKEWWNEFDVLLGKLSRRELTGKKAENELMYVLNGASDGRELRWACRVINKDLRCGVQVSTVNKVFPGLIEPFSVMLAREYDPDKHALEGQWISQPKLDGMRMVVIGGQAFTRNGRTIETVGHILEELGPYSQRYVFDGEVMGDTEFNADSGRTRRKGKGADEGLVYHVFDVIRRDQWDRRSTDGLKERLATNTHEVFDWEHAPRLEHVKLVPYMHLTDNTGEGLTKVRDRFIAMGYEGVMLKDMTAPYSWKRTDALLKFKDFLDADGTVCEFQEGRGRHRGRLGALICQFDGVRTRVGSGFSDEQRTDIWKDMRSYLGRTVEVKYQNKSKDGVLRFPVFVRFRGDK